MKSDAICIWVYSMTDQRIEKYLLKLVFILSLVRPLGLAFLLQFPNTSFNKYFSYHRMMAKDRGCRTTFYWVIIYLE